MYSVNLDEFIKQYDLKILNPEVSTKDIKITRSSVNRLALQLTGFYEYFDDDRIQVMGLVESTYVGQIDKKTAPKLIDELFAFRFPCLVFCRGLKPCSLMLAAANKYDIPILFTELETYEFVADVTRWLKVQLAPRQTIHGVLIDVYGEGILIMGESGIGKSETALELVKRGHRLVADDAVIIKKVSRQTLIGTSPEVIRYFIELRGIGIIDISKMFGYESVKLTQNIDLIINLESWDPDKQYDRLGMEEEYMDILGINIVCHTIPIRPGRNLAVICESAAVNHRQKKMGHNAAIALSERARQSRIDKKNKQNKNKEK